MPWVSDTEVLARTLWGEARGEGITGMTAVACVAMNRANSSIRWWGGPDVRSICLKPFQFSCWNKRDPNRPKLLELTEEDPIFEQALGIASNAVAGRIIDPTGGADSYRVIGAPAHWAEGLKPTAVIGRHEFFVTRKLDSDQNSDKIKIV